MQKFVLILKMLMKLALEKDFKFQNWVDSVFYLCTPKLGDRIYSLGSKKWVWSWKIVKEIQSTNSWWIGLRMSTLIAEQTLFGEVENHSVVRVFSLPSLAFYKDSFSIMDSGSAKLTWNLFSNKTGTISKKWILKITCEYLSSLTRCNLAHFYKPFLHIIDSIIIISEPSRNQSRLAKIVSHLKSVSVTSDKKQWKWD